MPSPVVRIDFKHIAEQILAMAVSPPPDPPPGPVPTSADVQRARSNATRAIGLIYIIEQADPGNAMPPLARIAHFQKQRDRIRAALDAHPFGQILTRPEGTKAYELRAFAPALATKPDLYAQVARYSVLQIRGVSFTDLRSVLPTGACIWDFGYQLEDLINGLFTGIEEALSIVGLTPDEPFFELSCHKAPTGPPSYNPYDWPIGAMKLREAWNIAAPPANRYGANTRIGHLDTGYSDHPALKGDRLLKAEGVDEVDNDPDARDHLVVTTFNSEVGHGTSTATLIMSASVGNPPTQVVPDGVIGAAPRAEIVPIRVCDSTAFIFNSKVAEGLAAAIARNCKVVSMSIGGFDVPGFEQLAEIASQQNILLIAAAGNCTYDVVAPASYNQVLAVGASSRNSAYWEHAPDDKRVDIAAPGDNVRTTWIDQTVNPPGNWKYNFGSGTSFSTAFVAGVAALWRAFHGEATLGGVAAGKLGAMFKAAVQSSANKPAGWNFTLHGAGIIDASALLNLSADAVFALALPPPPPLAANGAIDSAQSYLTRLSLSVYRASGKETQMLSVARGWFSVADDDSAKSKIDKFGAEMVNLLIKTKSDETTPAFDPIGRSPAAFLAFFQNNGSSALRAALTP